MSEYKNYTVFSQKEKSLFLKMSIIFVLLYTFHATHLSSLPGYVLFFIVAIWYPIFLYGQFWFHKFCAYKQAFTIEFKELTFDRFHLESHSTFTKRHWLHHGIPYSNLSIAITILTIGFIVFPTIYTYNHNKIEHRFFGFKKRWETTQGNLFPQENTLLRQSYAFFFANLYPLFWISLFMLLKTNPVFQTLLIITITHTFFNLFPLLPHMGFQYFVNHIYLWTASFTLFLIFSLFALFFTSFGAFFVVVLCCSAIILAIQFVYFTSVV